CLLFRQCRQEIEDGICSVILKHQQLGNETKKTPIKLKLIKGELLLIKNIFFVVGSVLHFTTFSVDKLGQPLVNENPQTTDGWEVPTYHQVFNQVIGTDGVEVEMKDKRYCHNYMAAINERRKEFNQGNNQAMQSNQRYHADEVEERFAKYKAGVMSEELLTALGLDGNALPPLIYRMRQLGYPPGWLKEAEMENSGLALYDGNGTDGQIKRKHLTKWTKMSIVMHETQYLAAMIRLCPHILRMLYSCMNILPHLYNKHILTESAASLLVFPSDPGTPYHHGSGDFQFQTPLPPGSPCFSSPPPLPQGTPPATPTPPPLPKGTPPPTPTNGSPALRGGSWTVVDETGDGTEDELSLEELEEQQRLIWAALENADTATNSDSETPATGTPVPSSSSVSTPVHVDTETEEGEEAMDTTKPEESFKVEDDSPQSPDSMKIQEGSIQQEPDQGVLPGGAADCVSPEHFEKIGAVPHRSNFAAGIVQFEDTPEFTEVAEATGTYLKIRDLLKCSPRNLAKKK
uniref:Zinc finger, CCHC domain containing 8 n=1 Tax=Labrus bergylta TaxID=56723 RepID=A0A3Q3FCC2_9LABR